jgi:hypothetical protein
MTHMSMSNPFITYMDPLLNQVITNPNHKTTTHITICTKDEFSLYPGVELEPKAGETLLPAPAPAPDRVWVMMTCLK